MSLKREKPRSASSQPYATRTSQQVLFCRGCARPCRTQSALDSHQRNCPQMKLGKLDSFFKLDPLRSGPPSSNVPTALQNLMASKETSEKVLPLSQSAEDNQPPPVDTDVGEKTNPSSQSHDSSTSVPLSTTSVDRSQAAGCGTETNLLNKPAEGTTQRQLRSVLRNLLSAQHQLTPVQRSAMKLGWMRMRAVRSAR